MVDNFRERLKRMMDEYRKRNLSVDEVYESAASRQLRLVSMCFDACIEAVLEHAVKYGKTLDELIGCGILDANATDLSSNNAVRAFHFYEKYTDIGAITDGCMKKIRQKMVGFLETHCELILILDGEIKSRERALQKAKESVDESVLNLNDINRLTVVSFDLDLLETFIHKLHSKNPPSAVCAKNLWEMKNFGMLSKSNYVFIDGFPAEIHLNEPKQMLVSKVITHSVYEVLRANVMTASEEKEFHLSYSSLPARVKHSIDGHKAVLSGDDLETMSLLSKYLDDMVMCSVQDNLKTKYDQLLSFHRKCHAVFFDKSSPEWKKVYEEARYSYNQKIGFVGKDVTGEYLDEKRGLNI